MTTQLQVSLPAIEDKPGSETSSNGPLQIDGVPCNGAINISRAGAGYRLQTAVELKQPLERVFPFFADARNLEQLTPPWLHFKILTQGEITMRPGTQVNYRISLHGIPLYWKTEIPVWEPPHRFVDRQASGPYLYWIHEHRFVPHGSHTLMLDRVDYGVRFGWLVHGILVQPDLLKIFKFRYQVVKELFGAVE